MRQISGRRLPPLPGFPSTASMSVTPQSITSLCNDQGTVRYEPGQHVDSKPETIFKNIKADQYLYGDHQDERLNPLQTNPILLFSWSKSKLISYIELIGFSYDTTCPGMRSQLPWGGGGQFIWRSH